MPLPNNEFFSNTFQIWSPSNSLTKHFRPNRYWAKIVYLNVKACSRKCQCKNVFIYKENYLLRLLDQAFDNLYGNSFEGKTYKQKCNLTYDLHACIPASYHLQIYIYKIINFCLLGEYNCF